MTDDLGRLLVEHALLEGDFVLRSGKRSSWYLDKYRFETRPDLLRALGARLAEVARDVEPDTIRLAGPALGAVALAASASMASELPFIIVRGETKEYGTANRIEGPFDQGDLVCLLEDVVTSGGALAESVSVLRDAGLVVRHAVCVVDREEGGADVLEDGGAATRPLSSERPPRRTRPERVAPNGANARSRRHPTGRRSPWAKIGMVEPSARSVRVSGGPDNDQLAGGVK